MTEHTTKEGQPKKARPACPTHPIVLSLYGLKLLVTNLCTRLDFPTPVFGRPSRRGERWRRPYGRATGEGGAATVLRPKRRRVRKGTGGYWCAPSPGALTSTSRHFRWEFWRHCNWAPTGA